MSQCTRSDTARYLHCALSDTGARDRGAPRAQSAQSGAGRTVVTPTGIPTPHHREPSPWHGDVGPRRSTEQLTACGIFAPPTPEAGVAELADALDSKSSGAQHSVWVRLPPPALFSEQRGWARSPAAGWFALRPHKRRT